jgi:hypothetical protein
LLLAGAVVCLVARVPLGVHRQLGFARTAQLVQSLSATPFDFLTRPAHAWIAFPPRERADTFTGGLFPGVVLAILAVGGAVGWLDSQAQRGPWRRYAIGATVAGALLALGLNLSIAGWQPFSLLRTLPGFDQIRSVFRVTVFAQVHLVFLAAMGLDALGRSFNDRARGNQIVLAVGLLASAENLSLPAPLLEVPRSPRTNWTAFVAGQPADTVLAHVPFPGGLDVEDFAVEGWRLFHQIDHGRTLVNGYASNFPSVYREFMLAMGAEFPKPILACALRTIFGANLLIVDQEWLSAHRHAFDELMPLLIPAYSDPAVAIFRLSPPSDACPPMRLDIGSG